MNSAPVTLLLTNSLDYVADIIVNTLGTEHLFRYNSDRPLDYSVRITPDVIELENTVRRRVVDANIAKVYLRSHAKASELRPDAGSSDENRYVESEIWSAWNEIINRFWATGKMVLVQPFTWLRAGKLEQLRIARRHFATPPYSFVLNRSDALVHGSKSVAKSFSFRFGSSGGFYARLVDQGELDPQCPWFLSDLIESQFDVTVAVVRDQLFAFSLKRPAFIDQSVDWRLAHKELSGQPWLPHALPRSISEGIHAFIRDVGSHYARLDFLLNNDTYTFLEANFTGEWGWLDPDGKHGLRDKILHEIDPRTPCVSCPRPTWTA